MTSRLLSAAVPAAILTIPVALAAQSWRTFDASRQLHDNGPLAVHVAYGAGRVLLTTAAGRSLYEVHLRYDIDRAEPRYNFDPERRMLDVGIRHLSSRVRGEGSELRLGLARGVPLSLDLDIGAAESDLDLGGLTIEDMALKTGATETRIRFDTPNPASMREMRIDAGAASVSVFGLGNANARRIDVNVGVGGAEFDFSGEWRGDTEFQVTSALGSVEITIPRRVGVRVDRTSFLHSFDAPGLVKRGDVWVSENWDSAEYKLSIRSTGTLGALKVRHVGR